MLAFLLTQREIFSRNVGHRMVRPLLDICHATAVPPIAPYLTVSKIAEETVWFREQVCERGPKVILGLQHPPLDANANDLEFFRDSLGIVFSTIAYQGLNRFGGGFAEPTAQLTWEGRNFLEMMSDAGMILDLSHAGRRTAHEVSHFVWQAGLELPIVATHTGCYGVYPHDRNLPDVVLREIANTGGIVGIYTMTFGLHESDNSIAPFIAHVRHAVNLLGEDAVVVGSDGIYQTLDLEEQCKLFLTMKDKIDPDGKFKARFPADPVELNTPDRMTVIENALAGIFPASVVEKIIGGNAHRFLSEQGII